MANDKLNLKREALEDCNKSIENDPKFTKSYMRRAELKIKNEDFNDAISDYWKIKEIDPSTSSTMD